MMNEHKQKIPAYHRIELPATDAVCSSRDWYSRFLYPVSGQKKALNPTKTDQGVTLDIIASDFTPLIAVGI